MQSTNEQPLRFFKPRLLIACRNQYEFQNSCLDDSIDHEHPAKRIWEYVELLDLSVAIGKIKSVEGDAGRPAIDPKILLALWLYATVEGIGSAYTLADYCREHIGFKWICGGVAIDRKTLSNFRTNHGDAFEELLIQGIAILTKTGQVTLKEIAQDGLRVRASAGRSSFRTEKSLEKHLKAARERIDFLKKEIESDHVSNKNRIKATQYAAATARKERLEKALKELEELRKEKDRQREKNRKKKLTEKEKAEVKVSTTDPESRIMIMPDNGYRPAYNIQFAVDTRSQVVVAVDVSKNGNDGSLMQPMYEKIKSIYGMVPERYLADAGFKNLECINIMHHENCEIYTPIQNSKKAKNKKVADQHRKKSGIASWLARMESRESQKIYKRRAASVECVNAKVRKRGFYQLCVRGLEKVKSLSMLMAITQNMTRTFAYKVV